MSNYKCTICGYIYIPERGDIRDDITPGTPFKDLPSDWVCPVCNANKTQFIEQPVKNN